MRCLVLYVEDADENEIFYEIKDIVKMRFDFAENVYSEAELRENNLKSLEILVVFDFRNGSTEAYSAMECEMIFD